MSSTRPIGCGCPPALMPLGWRAPSGFAAPTGPLVSPPRHQAGWSRFYDLSATVARRTGFRFGTVAHQSLSSLPTMGAHLLVWNSTPTRLLLATHVIRNLIVRVGSASGDATETLLREEMV